MKVVDSYGILVIGNPLTVCVHMCALADRIRSTLVHEMCHAATWIVDGMMRAGHGVQWTAWSVI